MVKFLKPGKGCDPPSGTLRRAEGGDCSFFRRGDEGQISKYPKKVIRKDSAKKQANKSRVKSFIKLVNYNHIMPTRYTLDVELKDVVTVDALQSGDKKVSAAKEAKAQVRGQVQDWKEHVVVRTNFI